MIGEELASNATLHKGLCVCSGRRPEETCPEGLAYKGPSCGMMVAQTNMYFSQELSSLLFEDAPLEDSSGTFLVQFAFMNFIGLRTSNYATGLILIIRKFLPIKVGQEGFGP